MSIWEYANPKKFIETAGRILPVLLPLAMGFLLIGLVWGFFFTPEDYKQGATVKIMFLHVPAAMMAINAWGMMLVASLIWIIRRHHVSALAARAAAPVGLTFTLIALVTGALWGQPMWGTWWEWDPRLTSFLILLLFYLGYIALWQAVENPDTAADLTGLLCVVGSVFALLSRYAVKFWNQGLHQDSTILKVGEKDPLDPAYYWPLIFCLIGIVLLFLALVLIGTVTEIRLRRLAVIEARERQEA
ncbi:heme ABC transporter permease [Gemmobacter serpentinus]|uniref:heme ABC transporter permease n=1 Tax=Gemmobacter serpentinus TaxID=2652247 RepID=UPI00124C71E1|nr:heme ABC transporter permease [Gemmobacter serpentinus]